MYGEKIHKQSWKESRLNFFDKIKKITSAFRFLYLSPFFYKSGKKSQIYHSVNTFDIGNISIGDEVQIRSYCVIDARSFCSPSIIIGNSCRIKEFVTFSAYGGEIHLGNNVLIGSKSTIHGHGDVYLGEYSGIGPGVIIVSSNHIFDDPESPWQNQGETVSPVIIEKNAWVGAGSVILAGVTVGAGAVIGAGSVVVDDIPSRVVAVGNPCKIIKHLRK